MNFSVPNGVGYGLEGNDLDKSHAITGTATVITGVTEANGSPGALEKRVILKHKAQAMDSSQGISDVRISNKLAKLRGAILRQIRSFFEHCSKSL